jgi:FKBP-type peptidyl-prolyl cis-trans isomerase FklB
MTIGAVLLAAQASAEETSPLKTLKEMCSYSIGVTMARNFKQQGIDLDQEMLIKGIKDALSCEKLLMTDQDIRITISGLQAELKQKILDERGMAKKAYLFLDENKMKTGVISLPSGLQYKILKSGCGKMPTDTDTVSVNYRVAHIDGTEFDSTHRTGNLSAFKVKEAVISGLSEALKLMPVGSKWQVFIPPQLAYGEQGLSPNIGPFETLIYELELLSIK